MHEEVTDELRLLTAHHGVREKVESLPEFIAWRNTLPLVEIDDETFHVVGGDQLKDRNQIIVEWVRRFRPEFLKGESNNGEQDETRPQRK